MTWFRLRFGASTVMAGLVPAMHAAPSQWRVWHWPRRQQTLL